MKNPVKVATPTDKEIVVTRMFDAPRGPVWDSMTKCELLKRWCIGPPGGSMTVCENDVKAGGTFRQVWRGPDGREIGMHGTYREVVLHERMVRTESFDFAPKAEQLATLVLEEQRGRTQLTLTLLYPSKAARDATLASGVAHGLEAGYDMLDKLLATQPGGRR